MKEVQRWRRESPSGLDVLLEVCTLRQVDRGGCRGWSGWVIAERKKRWPKLIRRTLRFRSFSHRSLSVLKKRLIESCVQRGICPIKVTVAGSTGRAFSIPNTKRGHVHLYVDPRGNSLGVSFNQHLSMVFTKKRNMFALQETHNASIPHVLVGGLPPVKNLNWWSHIYVCVCVYQPQTYQSQSEQIRVSLLGERAYIQHLGQNPKGG